MRSVVGVVLVVQDLIVQATMHEEQQVFQRLPSCERPGVV